MRTAYLNRTLKRIVVAAAFVLLTPWGAAYARTTDGDLSDWGVTPFTDWQPDAPAFYTEADYPNTMGCGNNVIATDPQFVQTPEPTTAGFLLTGGLLLPVARLVRRARAA